MARQEHVLSVFVASPSDVDEERNKLEEIIRELNVTWSRELGLRLDLIRWETHAFPGVGQDPQDVINTEISNDYDIFIGIMWHRFGTPTGRYGSGTLEEFERARKRAAENPASVKIMFYFRDSPPISMSQIDGNELIKIQNFRNSLGPEGTLYWLYTDITSFEKFVRLHLSRQVQSWKLQSQDAKLDASEKRSEPPFEPEIQDEVGFLELTDILEEHFASILEIVGRIQAHIEDLGLKVNRHTVEMTTITQGGGLDFKTARQEAKRLISRLSWDMTQFAERVNVEIPLFREGINLGLNAFIRSVELSVDFSESNEYRLQMKDALAATEAMNTAIEAVVDNLEGFRGSMSGLPRMTGDINKAKRQSVEAIDHLISELKAGNALGREAAQAVRDRLEG